MNLSHQHHTQLHILLTSQAFLLFLFPYLLHQIPSYALSPDYRTPHATRDKPCPVCSSSGGSLKVCLFFSCLTTFGDQVSLSSGPTADNPAVSECGVLLEDPVHGDPRTVLTEIPRSQWKLFYKCFFFTPL